MPIFTPSASIDQVVERLEDIIHRSKEGQSRSGFFAVLYWVMTKAIRQAINQGHFEDNARMERLDRIFADRYLHAYHQYLQGETPTQSWTTAFDAAKRKDLAVIQHLLLGVNAHINLDLCIASAQTSPGNAIHDLKNDFERINTIIGNLTGQMQRRLGNISWPMRYLTNVMNGKEEAVIAFSISKARQASWTQAVGMAFFGQKAMQEHILLLDKTVSAIGRKIINPSGFTRYLLAPVKWFEPASVSEIISILKAENEKTLLGPGGFFNP